MATGVFGTVRPSDVRLEEIEIYCNYVPDRGTSNGVVFRLEPTDVLSYSEITDTEDDLYIQDGDNILEGLYNLRLPTTQFNEIGYYTIYIRPKTHILEIMDCNVLSSLPNVRGILINKNDLPEDLIINNALQGYRIEYVDSGFNKVRNVVRYIITSNKVVPVNENVGNSNQSTTRYRFDDNGSLLFLQVTPSSSSNVKPNQFPTIGEPGQVIKISNTNFNPLVVEVEMVENTIDSLANLLLGEQTKDVKNGILTYYDKDREIVKQFNLFQIKDSVDNVPLYEVRELRENIDISQDIEEIIRDI